jgi:hypothetical protein
MYLLPMGPVWIVSIAIILFAALPDKVPAALKTPVGLIILAVVAGVATYVEPVLGAAAWIFMVSMMLAPKVEGFATCGASGSTQRNGFAVSEGFEASNLSKDRVKKGVRWLDERTLGENTRSIDTRTEDPTLTKDFVQGRHIWGDEEVLGENTIAIEERAVSDVPMYTRSGYSWHK